MEVVNEEADLPRDAPTLPRYPTLIRETMPRGTGEQQEDPLAPELPPSPGLLPPPRFPSMKDVDIGKATAIAEGRALPPSTAPPTAPPGTPVPEESVGRQLEQEINAAIERDAVERGIGAARAAAAASNLWSSSDQRHLNSLLRDAEGHLPTPRRNRQLSIDTFPTATSEGATVSPSLRMPKSTGGPRALSAPFPSAMATVPLTTFAPPGAGDGPQVEETFVGEIAEEDLDEKHASMVRSRSVTARVSITGDFGLKGGHAGVVRDSVFFDGQTLVTAGDDGKVCIWDLKNKYVKSEFLPYNGQPVQMLYPIVESDGSSTQSLITLSEDRLLRIWSLVDGSAVLLRSMQIPHSGRDLVMGVPVITPSMKAHAAASAAAAAVTTTDLSESAPASLDAAALPDMNAPHRAIILHDEEAEGGTNVVAEEEAAQEVPEKAEKKIVEEEQEEMKAPEKRFSFNIFSKNKSKKALAS